MFVEFDDTRGEVRRYYLAYVPDSYDPSRPAPLVFYLAGAACVIWYRFKK